MDSSKAEKGDLYLSQSNREGEMQNAEGAGIHDAVFGEIKEGGPNYRNVGWKGTVALMMKTQIGLGVLSIPAAFDVLGIVPGMLVMLAIAGITTWSDYMVGAFKRLHPEVYSIDDVGDILFGKVGRIIMSGAFEIYLVFIAGSAMLSISICLNALSLHGACTAVFVAVGAIIAMLLGSVQTLQRISWLALVGITSILVAILTLTISVGVQDRPSAAPQTGPWSSDYKIIGSPTFVDGVAAVSSLIFAYAGTPAFFSIVSEMREPQHFTRSLLCCQAAVTVTYTTIGVIVYYYCGSFVASPALGSAGPLMKRVCYGIALPGLIVTAVLYVHLPAKYAFVRLMRGSKHLTVNSVRHWVSWLACVLGVTIIAYVIASAIPVFGPLVSLVGALLGTLLSFQPFGAMWLYDNWGRRDRRATWSLMVAFSAFVIVIGTFLMVAGTYASIVTIIDVYKASGGSAAFSCADNSNSVGNKG